MSNERSSARHYCDHFECGKSFRRAEHLTRHKLNHTNLTIPCPQCSRLFYRRDLLQRHLILKHGKASKAAHGADSGILPPVTVSSLAPGGGICDPGPSAHHFQDTEGPSPFPPTTLAADAPMHGAAVDDAVLPMADDLFQFSSPSLDLGEDWGWLQQSPLPVFPVGSDPVGFIDRGRKIAEMGLIGDWNDPGLPQGLAMGQELYDFLANLGPVIDANHPLSTQDVRSILNTGFLFVMETVPIFHKPTFDFNFIQRELSVSIFCVGLLLAKEQARYHLGCVLLGQTRLDLLQFVHSNTIYLADLGILQAMLIIEFAGMYLADRTAIELSDIFHGTLVTLSRRLGIFEMTYTKSPVASVPVHNSDSIENEIARRLAYSVFSLDVGHALFFGHKRSILSIYSMKLELPAEDGDGQVAQLVTTHRTKFNVLCHNILSKPQGHILIPPNLSQFSNLMLLLGLASVVMDLLQRQQDPFFDTEQARSRLASVLPAIYSRIMEGPEGSMKLHGRAVYHITVIALCTPLDDLERAANDGFSRTGRTPKQHTRAAIIRLLTRHKVGSETARHALQLLKLYPLPQAAVGYSNVLNVYSPATCSPYESSALYFGALTLWAYVIGRVSETDDDGASAQEHSYRDGDVHSPQGTSTSPSAQRPFSVLLQCMSEAIDNHDSLACNSYWRVIVQHVTATLALRRNRNAQEYSQVLASLSDNLSI